MPANIRNVADRWEVKMARQLGEGGFGKVFRGSDIKEDPPVECAAKLVSLKEDADRKSFQSEISVLKAVHDHKSIIGLYGDAEEGATGWMFLEMATGGELFDRLIDSGSLSERAAWPYVHALVEAISFCHSRGVVHRDLKLENVMLCAEDPHAIRLIDFGLAVQLKVSESGIADNQRLNDSAGTQAYRAPEVSTAGYEPSKVDVWALGIVLFSLVAGFFPLQEAKMEDWRYKRLAGDQAKGMGACDSVFRMYKRQCPFSPALRELLDGMLKTEPQKRYSIAQVAQAEWMQTPQGGPMTEGVDGGPVYRSISADDFEMRAVDLDEEMVPLRRQAACRGF